MAGEEMLVVRNRHIEMCGRPPKLDTDGHTHTFYFENEYKEQIIFQFNWDKLRGSLWHGDWGWKPHEVVNGYVPGFIFNGNEAMWLAVCWAVIKEIADLKEVKI